MGPVHFFAVFLLLLYLLTTAHVLLHPSALGSISALRYFLSVTVPSLIVINARLKKNLTYSGCICAWFVGFTLILFSYVHAAVLITFFVTSSKLTKFRKARKAQFDKDYEIGAERNWEQVIANGGMALICALLSIINFGFVNERPIDLMKNYFESWYDVAILGCIAGSTADTWASEVGGAIGSSNPRLITTLRRVPTGTNGAISLVGTLASLAGGFLIGLSHYCFTSLFCSSYMLHATVPSHSFVIALCTLVGFCASMFDSLLGATLQYSGYDEKIKKIVQTPAPNGVEWISGRNLLNNNSVNLFTSMFSAFFAPYLARKMYLS